MCDSGQFWPSIFLLSNCQCLVALAFFCCSHRQIESIWMHAQSRHSSPPLSPGAQVPWGTPMPFMENLSTYVTLPTAHEFWRDWIEIHRDFEYFWTVFFWILLPFWRKWTHFCCHVFQNCQAAGSRLPRCHSHKFESPRIFLWDKGERIWRYLKWIWNWSWHTLFQFFQEVLDCTWWGATVHRSLQRHHFESLKSWMFYD